MDYSELQSRLSAFDMTALEPFLEARFLESLRHGDFPRWRRLIAELPAITPTDRDFASAVVRVGQADDAGPRELAALQARLRELIPWRKGPFELFGIAIDAEWRSDLKWDRLADSLDSLEGKTVLDVGCGNGYHCFRMRGAGASLVLGVDSHLPYVGQFGAIKRYLAAEPVHVLPLSLEQWPDTGPVFDTVFSMGVLYHLRSPFDHLLQIQRCLKPGGQLVLETIVVAGAEGQALTPGGRYARMGNVWFIPSVPTLQSWLRRCGFSDIHLIDESPTTHHEQRQTPWMPFDSLTASLDSDNPRKTIEGYPAPRRAIMLAKLP